MRCEDNTQERKKKRTEARGKVKKKKKIINQKRKYATNGRVSSRGKS